MTFNTGESPMSLSNRASLTSSGIGASALVPDDADLQAMRRREREIMELLGTTSPERLVHDVRNVLNELQLLREVLKDEKA